MAPTRWSMVATPPSDFLTCRLHSLIRSSIHYSIHSPPPLKVLMRMNKTILRATAVGLAAIVTAVGANAQSDYPTRPVTIVVPFPAGGATDIAGRLVAEGLSKKWGKSVVVDNKPGAGGNIGSEFVARAAPDGYTIILGGDRIAQHQHVAVQEHALPPAQGFRAFDACNALPERNRGEQRCARQESSGVARALLRDGKHNYSYGSDGNGTASHLGMELIKQQAKVSLTHIPYKGSAPMLTDLLGGQIQVGITGMPAVTPFVKSGKLRVIAVTTGQAFLQRA